MIVYLVRFNWFLSRESAKIWILNMGLATVVISRGGGGLRRVDPPLVKIMIILYAVHAKNSATPVAEVWDIQIFEAT